MVRIWTRTHSGATRPVTFMEVPLKRLNLSSLANVNNDVNTIAKTGDFTSHFNDLAYRSMADVGSHEPPRLEFLEEFACEIRTAWVQFSWRTSYVAPSPAVFRTGGKSLQESWIDIRERLEGRN